MCKTSVARVIHYAASENCGEAHAGSPLPGQILIPGNCQSRPTAGAQRESFGSRAGQTQARALMPLRSMTFSNFSDGPLGRFSPISHFCTVDTLVLRTAANTA